MFSETGISKLNLICNKSMPKCFMLMMKILEYSPKRSTIGMYVCTVIPRFTWQVLIMAYNFIQNCMDHLSLLLYDWYFLFLPTSTVFEIFETNTDGHFKANTEQPKQNSSVQHAWLDYQLGKLDQTTSSPKGPSFTLCNAGNWLIVNLFGNAHH